MKKKLFEQHLVTVAIPCYNHELFIQDTIQSVINQDYKNIELIIIDDGSEDQSIKKIKEMIPLCKERFSVFKFIARKNKGLSETLNEIINLSSGFYFSALASDDIIREKKISTLVESLELSDDSYCISFGDASFIDSDGKALEIESKSLRYKEIKKFSSFLDYSTRNRDFDYKNKSDFGSFSTLLKGNYLPAMSYVVKTNALKEVGLFTKNNTIEDWEIWLKLSKAYKFKLIKVNLAYYRLHTNNTIKTMRKEIILDSIKILYENKSYALENNYENIYFSTLADHIFLLASLDFKIFTSELTKNIFSIAFWKASISRTKLLIKLYFIK